MPESDLPTGTADSTSMTFDQGVESLESLDDVGSENPNPEVQAEASDVEPVEGEGVDDTATDDTADENDGPDEVGAGGKFVSNDAKVTLNDGTVISVQDLKRGFMSQQYFTRETTKLKEERASFEAEKSTIGQTAQYLNQQRDFLQRLAQRFMPEPPPKEMREYDPLGYSHAQEDYQERMAELQQLAYFHQTESGRAAQEQQQQAAQRRQQEVAALLEKAPEFREPAKFQSFWGEAQEMMAERYGFTAEELNSADNHRYLLIMRDLLRLHRNQKAAANVQRDVQQRPPMIQGGKRMDPKAKISRERQQRTEKLRQSGSFDDAVAALMDLS